MIKKKHKTHEKVTEDIKKLTIINNIKLCTGAKFCYQSKIREKYGKIVHWLRNSVIAYAGSVAIN